MKNFRIGDCEWKLKGAYKMNVNTMKRTIAGFNAICDKAYEMRTNQEKEHYHKWLTHYEADLWQHDRKALLTSDYGLFHQGDFVWCLRDMGTHIWRFCHDIESADYVTSHEADRAMYFWWKSSEGALKQLDKEDVLQIVRSLPKWEDYNV
jgi:hypothetical protein